MDPDPIFKIIFFDNFQFLFKEPDLKNKNRVKCLAISVSDIRNMNPDLTLWEIADLDQTTEKVFPDLIYCTTLFIIFFLQIILKNFFLLLFARAGRNKRFMIDQN